MQLLKKIWLNESAFMCRFFGQGSGKNMRTSDRLSSVNCCKKLGGLINQANVRDALTF